MYIIIHICYKDLKLDEYKKSKLMKKMATFTFKNHLD